jgi:hypothetical protein
MKIILAAAALSLTGSAICGAENSVPAEKTFDAPNGLSIAESERSLEQNEAE